MFQERLLTYDLMHNKYLNRLAGILAGKDIFRCLNATGKKDSKVYILVSFDCDRSIDTEALPGLGKILKTYDVPCSIATTGILVEQNPEVYRRFLANGHLLMNHGYSLHTNDNHRKEIYSTFFYNDVAWDFIRDEIAKAQDTYEKYLGIQVSGFRVPHFGTFQEKNKIHELYSILSHEGLKYSSSLMTLPMRLFQMNFIGNDKIVEVPLSNRVDLPFSVVDSHTLIHTPSRLHIKDRFYKAFVRMVDVALESKESMFINFYADPSQVVYEPQFAASLKYARSKGPAIQFMNYESFVKKVIKESFLYTVKCRRELTKRCTSGTFR